MFLSLIQRCWERVLPTEIFRLLSPLGFYSSSAFLPVFRLTLLKAILPYCGCLKPSLCFFNMVFQGLYDLAPDYFSDNQTVLCAYCVLATFIFFFLFLQITLFSSLSTCWFFCLGTSRSLRLSSFPVRFQHRCHLLEVFSGNSV